MTGSAETRDRDKQCCVSSSPALPPPSKLHCAWHHVSACKLYPPPCRATSHRAALGTDDGASPQGPRSELSPPRLTRGTSIIGGRSRIAQRYGSCCNTVHTKRQVFEANTRMRLHARESQDVTVASMLSLGLSFRLVCTQDSSRVCVTCNADLANWCLSRPDKPHPLLLQASPREKHSKLPKETAAS